MKYLIRASIAFVLGTFLSAYSSALKAQVNCPTIQINFNIDSVICHSPAVQFIDLQVELVGASPGGTGVWSGDNISNPTAGTFQTTFAQAGEKKVFYTYTEGTCTYVDSTTFLFSKLATPSFLASSQRAGHLCQDTFSNVQVTSSYDATTTNLVWDFSDGTSTEVGSPNDLQVTWDTPGSKLLSLQYEQFGCLSQPNFAQVIIDPTIDFPAWGCDNTLERVVYDWVDPPNSSATVVFVISGPTGVADTILDRYTIEDLQPGQTVQVRLVTTSDNTCKGNILDPFCESITCDSDLITIDPITTACVSSGATDTIDLSYSLLDTITQSTLTWSGAGVFDPTQARIVVDPSMAGQTQWVKLTFQSATCTVTDSVSFDLIPPPVADFTIPTTACAGEDVTAQYAFGTVPANSDTTLLWDFGDAVLGAGDPNTGTANLSWNTTGTKTVGLAIQVGACISDTIFRFVNVQDAPDPAIITCTPSETSILFSWQNIPGATFDVRTITGPAGSMVSTTSYEVTGLAVNQEVTIEVTTVANGLCNNRTVTQTCSPLDCPAIDIDIAPLPTVCLPGALPIDLSATITGDDGSGTLRWSGTNVSGSTWTPDGTLSGQSIFIKATYEEGGCVYEDSIQVAVPDPLIADFNLPPTACPGDVINVEALGNFTPTTTFEWQINGTLNASLVGPGPHPLDLSTPGAQEVSLTLVDGGCRSQTINRSIQVEEAFPNPVIICAASVDEILFSWDPIPGATAYIVNVLQGPAGTSTSDTSLLVTGLSPGQQVRIEVILENAAPCPDSRSELSCAALGCSGITIDIGESILPSQICIGNQDSIINLAATITGDNGTGTLTFNGTGVSANNQWVVTPAMAGQTFTIGATYQEDGCSFNDEVQVSVVSQPTASLSLVSTACLGSVVEVAYNGPTSPALSYQWTPASLTGPGPHRLNSNQAGAQTVSLIVSENGCSSEPVSRTVEILNPYTAPVISCDNGLNEVIFSWRSADVVRQAIIYNGPGTPVQTSDTSFVVSNLPPETSVNLEVQFIDDNLPCRNSSATANCRSGSCGDLSLNWSAPQSACTGEPFLITFATTGAGASGFDVAIRQGSTTTTYGGITDGSTLSFDLAAAETFTVISAGLAGNTFCTVSLPPPLSVTVELPEEAGIQATMPSVCEGTDTLINLASLLTNASLGGDWSFISGPENPASAFSTTIGTVRLDQLTGGTYVFQYRVGSNASCQPDSVLVNIEILDSPVADAGPDLSLDCQFNIASIGSSFTTPGLSYQWQGSNLAAIQDPTAAITEVSQEGTYSLLVSNAATRCSAIDEVVVGSSPGMITPFTTTIPVSCYDSNDGIIIIDSVVGGSGPFMVTLNDVNQGNRTAFSNLRAGNYDMRINSSDGCEASLFLNIGSPSQLEVQIDTDLERDQTIISAGDSVQLTALVNVPESQIAKVVWLPDTDNVPDQSLTKMVGPVITSSYGVEITDLNGCTTSDRIALVVKREANVYMANAFSPNEDGSNDVFYIQSDQSVREILSFNIFNRWGEQLFVNKNFQPNDPMEGWDGNVTNNPQPPAVYIYMVELELANGEIITMEGDIALLR